MTAAGPGRTPVRPDPAGPDGPVRVVVLTDTDSYVKWGAALASALPGHWRTELVVARSAARPSPAQLSDALSGTSWAGQTPRTVSMEDLRDLLTIERPDVLVLAARGYTVEAAMSLVENEPHRPVLVTGLPGVGIPVLPYGLGFRRAADVFVVHSRREVREFTHAAARLGLPARFALARLPYLPEPGAATIRCDDGPVVFAAQALVPAARADRVHLVDRLAEAARARPDREVVIKVRAMPGEAQTHHEQVPLGELVEALPDRPANLVVRAGPMREALQGASALVTVSSTALLEAVAAGVPVLALDDYGIGVEQINVVLQDSGVVGSTRDLVAGRFAAPRPGWLADNYFHDPGEDTWLARVQDLLAVRACSGLPPFLENTGLIDRRVRRLMYRHFAFSDGAGTGLSGGAQRVVVDTALWLNQRRSGVARLLWRSPRGARAVAFAQENTEQTRVAAADASSGPGPDRPGGPAARC